MGRARSWLGRLVDTGVSARMSSERARQVRVVNLLALSVASLLGPYLAGFVALAMPGAAALQGAAIAVLLTVVLLNRLGRTDDARVLTVLVGNLHVCGMTLAVGRDAGVSFYAFAAVAAPLFVYPARDVARIGAWVVTSLVLVMGADRWVHAYAPSMPLPAWAVGWFYLSNLVGGLLTVVAFTAYANREAWRCEQALITAREDMAKLAETDGLTGLANRRKLQDALTTEWARAVRGSYPLSIILVDVDQFKQYNDAFGHVAGDAALVRVAGALRAGAHRPADLVGRFGGEEFLVVLPDADRDGATRVAERMRQQVRALDLPHAARLVDPWVTGSFGVCTARPAEGGTFTDLLCDADHALYQAKSQGRNRVVAVGVRAPPRRRSAPG